MCGAKCIILIQEKTHKISKLREESAMKAKQIEENEKAINNAFEKLLKYQYIVKEKRKHLIECQDQIFQVLKLVNSTLITKIV